jgi:hypothetical protein
VIARQLTTRDDRPEFAPPLDGAHERAVVTIRARVRADASDDFIAEALRDIRAYLQEHHTRPIGPPFAICQPCGSGQLDVEAGWPIPQPIPGTSRIHTGTVPTALARSLTGDPANRCSALTQTRLEDDCFGRHAADNALVYGKSSA